MHKHLEFAQTPCSLHRDPQLCSSELSRIQINQNLLLDHPPPNPKNTSAWKKNHDHKQLEIRSKRNDRVRTYLLHLILPILLITKEVNPQMILQFLLRLLLQENKEVCLISGKPKKKKQTRECFIRTKHR